MSIRIGITRCMNNTVEGFTTDIGIKARRWLFYILKPMLQLCMNKKVIVESFPTLDKKKAYIFASTHYIDEDVFANIAYCDRNIWALCGSTNQIEKNPLLLLNWLTGIIYVNRLNPQSRKDSISKMKRILTAGSSVLLYPEGSWNNSENLLVQKLFFGAYYLSKDLSIPVIPVSVYRDYGADEIYYKAGEPLNLFESTKEEANVLLRDTLATMMYEQIEAHSKPLHRSEMKGDIHVEYMEMRRQEYLREA